MTRYQPGTWIFLGQGSNRLTEQLTGRIRMPPDVLEELRAYYDGRRERLAGQGIPYVAMIAPEKQCVYPELVPPERRPTAQRTVLQMLGHLERHGTVRPLYPVEALMRAKAEGQIYFHEDTHWTFLGAFTAYQTLMRAVAAHVPARVLRRHEVMFYTGPPRHPLQRFDTLCPHDLANKIEPDYSGAPHRVMIHHRRARMTEDNRVVNTGHKAVFEQDAPELPAAVLLRDSYADMMLPFLAESFRRLVAIWQPTMDWGLVERERPDIVMSLQAERFVVHINDDVHSPDNAALAADKIAQGLLTPDPEPARPAT